MKPSTNKKGPTLKGKNLPLKSKFFPIRADPTEKGYSLEHIRVASPKKNSTASRKALSRETTLILKQLSPSLNGVGEYLLLSAVGENAHKEHILHLRVNPVN